VTWNLNADPAPQDSNAAPGGRGGRGGGGGGGGGAGRGGNAPAPQAAGGVAPCQGGGGGGGGRGGFGGGARVAPGVYRASIGKMVGTTVTTIGPTQTFSVLPLPAGAAQ
jgi:hypothetical protein